MNDSTFGGMISLVGVLSIVWGAFGLIDYQKGDGRGIAVRILGGLGVALVGLVLKHFGV